MRISVIVPARNAENSLSQAISSLLDQDHDDYEIIVVDNCSTDRTAEIISRCPVKSLSEKMKGAYFARNTGAKIATGSIFAFTDADCIIHKSWLSSLDNAFKDSSIMIAGGPINGYRPKNMIEKFCDRYMFLQERSVELPFFSGNNLAIRSAHFKKHQGFDTNHLFGGDTEFCLSTTKKEIS